MVGGIDARGRALCGASKSNRSYDSMSRSSRDPSGKFGVWKSEIVSGVL